MIFQADVLCRMLGYPGAMTDTDNSFFGDVFDEYAMDDVFCVGDEASIYDCEFSNTNDCSATEAAGVICRES